MKYNIGDVVQLNSMWDNRYGIIIHINDTETGYPSSYRIIIQGNSNPAWMAEFVIVRKID
jgi:hypothetical protein